MHCVFNQDFALVYNCAYLVLIEREKSKATSRPRAMTVFQCKSTRETAFAAGDLHEQNESKNLNQLIVFRVILVEHFFLYIFVYEINKILHNFC